MVYFFPLNKPTMVLSSYIDNGWGTVTYCRLHNILDFYCDKLQYSDNIVIIHTASRVAVQVKKKAD